MSGRKTRVWPGAPYPLGATWDGRGVNFALFSENAEKVELCLFDEGPNESERIELREYTDSIWHCYLPDARPGQAYGYRVYGPYDPENGHRFNHHKLLLDPYAKGISGRLEWSDTHFAYELGHAKKDLSFDRRDNADKMPRCRVVDTAFTWGDDRRPHTPWHATVLYEAHVKGYTMRHPGVAPELRGSFSGLSSSRVIEYLKSLGITAVELLPVQYFIHDRHLIDRGLANYWGYNPIGFFAPAADYMRSPHLFEFKNMVRSFHDANIEVVLDVVYNHTAEGNQLGPTLCFRGIDNKSYYRLLPGQPQHYDDFTGCGNALNLHHPRVLQLVMDSLRYWVEEMHVDGFRFDLASTLAREKAGGFDPHSGFLDAVQQDPVLSSVKLIAEPWDVGMGGYQLGQFPAGWAEWNDRYRDTVRRFWKGDGGVVGELATRLTGSSDLFARGGRRPWASINFVTAHDGFTLTDLVSYNSKHNAANLEDNRDGTEDNHSWNCGAEGPSKDWRVLDLRLRQKRNFLATMILSQGTPMLTAGDEIGRSQSGNNNAYCHDDELSWIDWSQVTEEDERLRRFVQQLLSIRGRHVVFHRNRFFEGLIHATASAKDIVWLRPDGEEMTPEDWRVSYARVLAYVLNGEAGTYHLNPYGEPERDDSFVIVLNAHDQELPFRLPTNVGHSWEMLIDTATETGSGRAGVYSAGGALLAPPFSFSLFVSRREDGV